MMVMMMMMKTTKTKGEKTVNGPNSENKQFSIVVRSGCSPPKIT